MRPSNRSKILDAAIRVIHREGVTGVTFDSVAAEAGVTRGGMMYHFPARDDLIAAINHYLAERWQDALVLNAGTAMLDGTADQRFRAYALTCAQSTTRAELLFFLETAANPELARPWDALLDRWAPPPPQNADDQATLSRFIARLAADGLWIYDSLSSTPLPAEIRQRLTDRLQHLIASDWLENTPPQTGEKSA